MTQKAEVTSKDASLNTKKKEGLSMRTLSYYIEPSAELELALNVLIERIPCFADWSPLGEDDSYLMVMIECREEDAAFVERMLAPFV